jgi:hypothetical protein
MKSIAEYLTLLHDNKMKLISKINSRGSIISVNSSYSSVIDAYDNTHSRLNIFHQLDEPHTYDGIWCKTDSIINKIAQTNNFLNNWSSNFINLIPKKLYSFGCIEYQGKIHCIGGCTTNGTSTNTHYIYDIINNTWTEENAIPINMDSFGCVLYNNKIYCIGGKSGSTTLNTTYIYDIIEKTWVTGKNITTSKHSFGCIIKDDIIYCISGQSGNKVTNTNIQYSIINNVWSSKTNITTAIKNFGIAEDTGNIYCMGGCSTNVRIYYNNLYYYNISLNKWFTGIPIPTPKYSFGSVKYNNKIYCIGGYATSPINTNWVLDLKTNSWIQSDPMNLSKYSFSIIGYNDKLYCIGGYSDSAINTSELYSLYIENLQLYDSDTVVIQRTNSYNPYEAVLFSNTNNIIGRLTYPFSDIAVNGINIDIYYGDGIQWIKIKSAT